ncbi:hypothetical protein FHN55_05340 [Streptomyces sp. NP160]|uniref:hypothetical protein n=1 Tax=Streptomyces sp. NP160 TaxID=2586637 RepID=UPI00111B02C9|nr:hypothetical protein [Streptomyces sp. NP160]TNM69199.1 hypothetical protein FHN55_05340 [Streptomyces sp. NP160]
MTTPANTSSNHHGADGTGRTPGSSASGTRDDRRAGKAGLGVAALGVVVLNVAPFMDWVDPAGEGDPRTGYATDSLVPFTAYLALGLLLAMLYAAKRARRGQHRGLTLVSMASGLAATVQFVAFALQPMGGLERGDDLAAQVGVYVAIIGSALWALGSGLLAKEVEGDDHHDELTRAERTSSR